MVQKSCSPVKVDSLDNYLRGFIHPSGAGVLPITVCTVVSTPPKFKFALEK